MAPLGIGSGLTMPLTANVLAVLPHDRAGVASGILNAAREVAGLLGVTVIGAILTARRAQVLAAGATPTTAFLHGYTTGLLAAALLVAIGGAVSLATLDRTATPQPAPAAGARPARRAAATGSGTRQGNADPAGVRVAAAAAPPRSGTGRIRCQAGRFEKPRRMAAMAYANSSSGAALGSARRSMAKLLARAISAVATWARGSASSKPVSRAMPSTMRPMRALRRAWRSGLLGAVLGRLL